MTMRAVAEQEAKRKAARANETPADPIADDSDDTDEDVEVNLED